MGGCHGLEKPIERRRRNPLLSRLGEPLDRVEQLRGSLPGQRGEMNDGGVLEKLELEPQTIVKRFDELLALRTHQIPFVDRDDDRTPGLFRFSADRPFAIARAFDRVHNENSHVGS